MADQLATRKSFIVCWTTPFSMILSHPHSRFQGHMVTWRIVCAADVRSVCDSQVLVVGVSEKWCLLNEFQQNSKSETELKSWRFCTVIWCLHRCICLTSVINYTFSTIVPVAGKSLSKCPVNERMNEGVCVDCWKMFYICLVHIRFKIRNICTWHL